MKTLAPRVFSLYAWMLLGLALGALASALTQQSSAETFGRLQSIANGAHRPDADRARDVHRHPVETLAFFGIREDMTVVEVSPGGGWYTRVLAPLLKDKGKLYLAGPRPNAAAPNATNRLRDEVAGRPDVFGHPVFTVFEKGAYEIAPAASADLVLTFRNLHNWMANGTAEDAFKSMYRALKRGGVLGFVEHRANPGAQDPLAKSGYVTEDYAIKLAQAAGFRLAARSEVNANPKDTKDYAQGVWTLPPTYRLKDVDRARFEMIGESDRMTLKFVKP